MSEFKKLRYFIIELFLQTNISLEKSEWSLESRVTKFPYECFIGFVHNETWGKLPERIKEMLFSYFENEQDNRRLVTLRTFIRNLISHNKLEDCFIGRYTKKLKLEPFNSAIQYYGNNKLAFQRVWDELITYKFDIQNQVVDFLYMDSGIELISGLDSCEQIKLGRLIKRAAMGSHWKSQSFIRHVYSNSNYSESLKQGMAVGAFIDLNDSYDMRADSLFDTVKLINELPTEVQVKIYETIESSLMSDKIDDFSIMIYDEIHFSAITNKIMEIMPDFKEDHLALFKKYIELVKVKFTKNAE